MKVTKTETKTVEIDPVKYAEALPAEFEDWKKTWAGSRGVEDFLKDTAEECEWDLLEEIGEVVEEETEVVVT